MKKIDKQICIAQEYYKWQETSTTKYYSSHKYYKDVLVSLISCQDGLCAYSEIRLIDKNQIPKLKSKIDLNGKYTGDRPEAPIDNEHFNSKLKSKNGWAWDNFFGVFSYVNRDVKRVRESELNKKGKTVSNIFRPDHEKYDPFKFMTYDFDEHMFIPNPELEKPIFEEVKEMIYTLGINSGFVRMRRKEYISKFLLDLEFGMETTINQFPTAVEFAKLEHQKNE